MPELRANAQGLKCALKAKGEGGVCVREVGWGVGELMTEGLTTRSRPHRTRSTPESRSKSWSRLLPVSATTSQL